MKKCFSCGKPLEISGKPGRRDDCPSCGADLRTCYNCRFYDKNAYNECSEPVAERVVEKDKANFCDYFDFVGGGSEQIDSNADAKKKLDDLFG